MVGWRTPAGNAYGVVVGRSKRNLLCLTMYDRTLQKDRSLRFYRDEALSKQLAPAMPGVLMDLQRVPSNKAFKRGRIRGRALQPYTKAAASLQLEGTMNLAEEGKWIQKAVKRPGRLRRILGVSDEQWRGMSKGQKLKLVNAKLKTSTDKSERGALLLGKRFISGAIEHAEDVDLPRANALLTKFRERLQ